MKLNMVLVAFCLTMMGAFLLAQPSATFADERSDGIRVSATAYTCDVHPRNPMSGCRRLRWGGNVNDPGMACPTSWRNDHFEVEGFGVLRCDDTGRYDTWNGLPHIDIRVTSWEEARDWGVRTITIYPTESTAAATTSAQSSAAPTNTQQYMAAAKSVVPRGDATTAVVRRTRFDAALTVMPWLGEVVKADKLQSLWLVTLWQPRDLLPADATALPNRDEPIATTLVIVNGDNGTVLGQTHITMDALNVIVALPQDAAH